MGKALEKHIIAILSDSHKPLSINDIIKIMLLQKNMAKRIKDILKKLAKKKLINKSDNNLFWDPMNNNIIYATVTKINSTFGFVKVINSGEEIFIPGRYMLGALPGDTVIISKEENKSKNLSEGKILIITSFTEGIYNGRVKKLNIDEYRDEFFFSSLEINFPLKIIDYDNNLKENQLIKVNVIHRGRDIIDHSAVVISYIGDALNPEDCCKLIMQQRNIRTEFDKRCLYEADYIASMVISEEEQGNRIDLTNEMIFTIDSEDSKDLDDAISISRSKEGYWNLGVHIADVSYYVKQGSNLDQEAFDRGTSIYYADKVIPMLPKELSNGICSLNPMENRLAFSALLKLDTEGTILSYEFKKTIIKSKVKGIYKEINQILEATENEQIKEKYSQVRDKIFLMSEFADILTRKRFERGSLNLETAESKIKINKDAINIVENIRGKSELIIEEFMLKANEAAAMFAQDKKIPFIYRIHEEPPAEKYLILCNVLTNLNLPLPKNESAIEFSKILSNVEGTNLQFAINNIILRSLAKAKYSSRYIPHYGLALNNYAHFTSPIRRYPDLFIHRIMGEYIKSDNTPKSVKNFGNKVENIALQNSICEKLADSFECECEDIYKAYYMSKYINEEFNGIVCSVTQNGIYVRLFNIIEGFIHQNTLPKSEYEFINMIEFRDKRNNDFCIRIGDEVKVKIIKTDIFSGQIDFSLLSSINIRSRKNR